MSGRILTIEQRTLLTSDATLPTYLVDLHFGDHLHLSTNGAHEINGTEYVAGECGLAALDGFERALLYLRRSAERNALVLDPSGGWRGRDCVIWLLPAVPDPEQGVVTGERINVLEGAVDSHGGHEWMELSIVHRALLARWVPWIRIGAPWCYHLNMPGEVIEWDGERILVEE